jgi:hypothetical protein
VKSLDAKPEAGDATSPPRSPTASRTFGEWLLGAEYRSAAHAPHGAYPWWKVMCLTGVDYFSTLGYQPGIAFLAAGILSPLATLVLVLVTLGVAVPVYSYVATKSPHGQGSILMLEGLLPRWRGKTFVLVLLGFAATDFVITITLSAADATDHVVHNPFTPAWLDHPLLLTLLLLSVLGGVFLKGFREAIGIAVFIVLLYLALNVVVLAVTLREIARRPELLDGWWRAVLESHEHPLLTLGAVLIVFPRLALGLSGFETGVAVMPLVKGHRTDTEANPTGRIRNTRKLLLTAALLMSFMLIGSSLATTLLIPAEAFAAGGAANGRALAYLAHRYLGSAFGTCYDVSTIVILWFAGASALAGLLNLVPRYLPPYGMAPEWARATRPLVLAFTLIAFVVTILFDADVDAQGGAYATGVLFLMSSASLAVTLANWRTRWRWVYLPMTLVFVYTTALNVAERPEGIKIASGFIGAIIVSSLVSRALRSTELRVRSVQLDEAAARFIDEDAAAGVRLIAHRPDNRTIGEYDRKMEQAREDHSLDRDEPVLFLEVEQGDASVFSTDLLVKGHRLGPHRVLRCTSPAIPNAIAALLIEIRDRSGRIPDAYFGWTEGNPVAYVLRFLALGEGDTAPITREVLRRTIASPLERPRVHVG